MKYLLQSLKILIPVFMGMTFTNVTAQVRQLEPTGFQQELAAGKDIQLIDVCTPGEFSQRHITGAVNLDFYRSDFKEVLGLYDREKPVYVYCLAGGRSAQVVSLLGQLGFKNVTELKGGIRNWMSQGKPVDKITEAPKGMEDNEYNGIVASAEKVLIVFSTEWCPPCKRLQPSLDSVQAEIHDKVLIRRLDGDVNKLQADRHQVEGFPTLILYDKGKEVWRSKGYMRKDQLLDILK